ncbi:40S ribosomal protein S13 [Lemmus lemmus]
MGLSQLVLLYHWSIPASLKLASNNVKDQLYKLGKKSPPRSQIGEILKDSHAAVQAHLTTGNKSLRILKTKGFAPDLPKILCHLIRKAVAIPKQLERNRKDKDAKFRCILRESTIHLLACYYRTKRVFQPSWKHESPTVSSLAA